MSEYQKELYDAIVYLELTKMENLYDSQFQLQ